MAPRSSSDHARLVALERCAVVVLGIYLAAGGLNAIAAGHWMYRNYLRSPVAAPVAIAIGVVLIIAGTLVRE